MKKLISTLSAAAMLAALLPGAAIQAAAEDAAQTKYVLSNNAFNDADRALYQNKYGISLSNLSTNASYTWDTEDADIKKQDAYATEHGSGFEKGAGLGQEMIGGSITTDWHTYYTNTSWDSGLYSTICFDLNSVYYVNQVDIFNFNKRGGDSGCNMEDISVSVGETRDQMTEVVTNAPAARLESKADYDNATTYITRTPISFEGVNARYINVTFKKGTLYDENGEAVGVSHKAYPAEFVIFGKYTSNSIADAFEQRIQKINGFLNQRSYYTEASLSDLESQKALLEEYADQSAVLDTEAALNLLQTADAAIDEAIDALVPAKTHYTLSGNAWQGTDQTFYDQWDSSMTLTTLTTNAPSAVWDESYGDTDLTGDASSLIGGNLSTGGGKFGKYGGTAPGAAIFDLGGTYPVDRVDVIMRDKESNELRDCTYEISVYTSEDGENYSLAAEKLASHDNTVKDGFGAGLYFNSLKFPVTNAKYVKVVAWKQGIQQIFAEMAVFGYDSPMIPLNAAIAETKAFIAKESVSKYYTKDSVAALQAAIDAAEQITLADGEEKITSAIQSLNDAKNALESVFTRAVVSGNTFTEDDIAYYKNTVSPAVDLIVDTNGASYEWAEKHDPDLESIDSESNTQRADRRDINGNALTDGSVTALGKNQVDTVYKWWTQDPDPAVAVFDLKNEKVIDRVDVFSTHEQNKAMGLIQVEVSTDGENYTEAASVTANGEILSEGQKVYMTPVRFAPEKARYVRVSMDRRVGVPMTVINEVIIFGIGASYAEIETVLNQLNDQMLANYQAVATENSYENLTAAIRRAKAVMADGIEDQAEITKAAADVQAAIDAIEYTVPETIVTNNKQVDSARYAAYENQNIGMTYDISPADGQLAGQDTSRTRFTDGELGTVAYGQWGGDHTVSITFDAMKNIYFTGLDLFDGYDTQHGVDNLTIEVSENGTDYTQVLSATDFELVLGENGEPVQFTEHNYNLQRFSENFMPQYGRYLRVTTTKKAYQQVLSEIVIRGIASKQEKTALSFEATEYSYYNMESGDATETLTGADYAVANGHLTNHTGEAVVSDVYTAFYQNGRLIKVVKTENQITVPANGQAEWSTEASFERALSEGVTVTNFVWSSSLTPLAEAQR